MTDEIRSFWDIEEPQSPGDLEFLPPIPSPWQSGKEENAGDEEIKEHCGKETKSGLTSLLEQLWHIRKQKRRNAARKLGIFKKAETVPALIRTLDDPSFFVQREAALALGSIGDARAMEPMLKFLRDYSDQYFMDALNMIIAGLKQHNAHSFCMVCLRYAGQHGISLPDALDTRYYACRTCHSNGFMIQGVEKVTLCLDHSLSRPYFFENKQLTIHWYRWKKPLDCDEINIMEASDHDAEELVMKLKNDMDKKSGEALKLVHVRLSSQLTLSKAKRNLLNDTFILHEK